MGKQQKVKQILKTPIRRLILKVGSGVIAEPEGGLNQEKIEEIVREVVYLKDKGIEVILVSSGAIACGMSILGLKKRPSEIPKRQALAALGQAHLIMTYERFFEKFGMRVGQVLLTRDDVENRRRYLNAKNAITELLKMGIVPIINENDTVMVEEIKFGDNDRLSALVAIMMEADLLVMLSTVEGLYTADPLKDKKAELIKVVEASELQNPDFCDLRGCSYFGSGGMESKIIAISQVVATGIPAAIVKGRKGIVKDLLEGKPVGTFFIPSDRKIMGKKRWLAFATHPSGKLIIDDGAYFAICKRGKSLLPSGIIDVEGTFDVGDVVSCVTVDGKEVARGLVNYPSKDIERIKGLKSSDIENVLGYKHSDEVIHRDNMVICEGLAIDALSSGGGVS